MMRLFSTTDLGEQWESMVAHEKRLYPLADYREARETVLGDWWKNNSHWWVAVGEMETGEIVSSASATLLAKDDLADMMKRGEFGPKSLPSYYKTAEARRNELPMLYISSVIVANRMHAPYLFKALSRDLKAAQKTWGVAFEEFVTIAVSKKAKFLADRYGFRQIGFCMKKYPVYRARREDSPLLTALVG